MNSSNAKGRISVSDDFLAQLTAATTSTAIEAILTSLPVVDDDSYAFDPTNPSREWQEGGLHWFAVGGDRGNAGRIKLAGAPENPIGERTVNSMEGLIELARRRELLDDPSAPCPTSPREAVKRYFKLPPLDVLPDWPNSIEGRKPRDHAREIARRIRVRLVMSKSPKETTIAVEDDGIGQSPTDMHSTLLSLGNSDKGDKPYLIGVFGQGGSSAYAASEYSFVISRRAPELRESESDGDVGWTIVRNVFLPGRRDHYYAYLAASPDGRVPVVSGNQADELGISHGTRFCHVNYDFGKTEPSRSLYQTLNHLLFNPVLPYELITGEGRRPDPMWGNAYRLSKLSPSKVALDKRFDPQPIS